jgi:zinc transport system ATP-binding protein
MDVVRMGRLRPRKVWGFYSREDRQAAWAALEQVELAHLAGTAFGALSGGQRQRVLVARALALRPALLLLDEPTANVDPASQHEIYDLMQRLSGDTTVIMVTHDMNFVSSSIRQVVCVNRTVDIHPTTDIPSELSCHLTSAAGVRFVRHDRSIRDRESP